MNNTNDARVHQAALDLLAEVSDYLSRLPTHPMTHAMHQKVLAYLDDPSAKVKRESLVALAAAEKKAELVKSGQSFSGTTSYIPSGVPVLECQLLYPELRIESPAYQQELDTGGDAEAVLMHIAKGIAQGLTISMSQDVFLPRASRRLSQLDAAENAKLERVAQVFTTDRAFAECRDDAMRWDAAGAAGLDSKPDDCSG